MVELGAFSGEFLDGESVLVLLSPSSVDVHGLVEDIVAELDLHVLVVDPAVGVEVEIGCGCGVVELADPSVHL